MLNRLVWGPPYGQVTADPAPWLRWLIDRGLLLPTAPGTVVLPREVALHLRAGRAHREVEPVAPAVEAKATHRPQVVDTTAAGQAYTALATVEELLKDWDEGGPAVMRAGGLSVRDLKRTAVALDVSEPVAAFWVELAYAAGLLASDGDATPTNATRRPRPTTSGSSSPPPSAGPGSRRPGSRRPGPPVWSAAGTRRNGPCPRWAPAWTARRLRRYDTGCSGCSPGCPRARRRPRSPCWPGCGGSGLCEGRVEGSGVPGVVPEVPRVRVPARVPVRVLRG